MKLSVVIPARNEEGHLDSTLEGLVSHLDTDTIRSFEIIVVDDGSTDRTPEILSQWADREPRVRPVFNSGRNGYGRAVRCGLDTVTGDAVIITMADASDDPADIVTYYHVLRDEAECVFGSRFISGSKLEDYPRFKLVINRLVNSTIRLMFGLKCNDVTNAFKGFRRYVIDGCRPLVSPHFNLTIELPLKALVRGYTFKVVPISWRNRTSGESQLLLKEQGSRYLFTLLSVWFEWLLVRRDFRRADGEEFKPWTDGVTEEMDG
ncbi:MAG: glycosyltransferase family 2 protein [Acidobacteria bacterium]|nr:MAG: glycosyltransferase family 2 protein [Acidobacteriota bacterium]